MLNGIRRWERAQRGALAVILAAMVGGWLLAPEAPARALVTNEGKQRAVAAILDGTARPNPFNWVAIGSGTGGGGTCTSAAATDVKLDQELARAQDSDASPDPAQSGGGGYQQQLIVTFGAGTGTGTICEVAVYNHSTEDGEDCDSDPNECMLVRNTFTGVNKTASDAMNVTVTITGS